MAALPDNLPRVFAELLDGELDDAARRELETLLRDNPEVRKQYLEFCAMHAMLQFEHGALGGVEKLPLNAGTKSNVKQLSASRWRRGRLLAGAAMAALVVTAAIVAGVLRPATAPVTGEESSAESISDTVVAQITGCKEARFESAGSPTRERGTFEVGTPLRQGQQIALTAGFAEITFNCGAQVVLEGPARLDVGSAWGGTLKEGVLRASVPPQAVGFRISAPTVDVIDLGTEFSIVAEPSGETEVFVLKGAVKAEQTGSAVNEKPIVLTKAQSRRFARSGSSPVTDAERKAKRWEKVVEFERHTASREYVHISFDENAGKGLRVDSVGKTSASLNVFIKTSDGSMPTHVPGRFNNALKFEGNGATKIPLAGLGDITPRTFALWLKLDPDTPLSDGNAVLGWSRRSGPPGRFQSLEIGWNANPEHGALGALRVGRGRGFIIGSTPLRDGRWHHIAVVIVPEKCSSANVDVNLYVDGRLEGITSKKSKQKRAEETAMSAESQAEALEWLWLGRGMNPKDEDRFCGELDELYIVESALTPAEIQRLMNENAPGVRSAQ
ncbi:MAG TPA: LamG-like jellyroll fold domain-containing protein [Planctomycetota bacterium]|nr:LamG-like jellyroll fold domain-containing protein [Planctomycetota bacterium]